MFKIVQNPTFKHPVKIRVPVDGGFANQEFTATFRVEPWDEVKALDSDPAGQLRRVFVGWEGITDDGDKPIPYSDAVRDQLIGLLYVRVALLRTYVEAITGAARGN